MLKAVCFRGLERPGGGGRSHEVEVWRRGLLNYVVAGSLAADVMAPLQVFWVSGKQAGYDGALFLIPGCSSGCLFPSFFCRWGCPGRLGYPLSRRSVQVLCGSGNHSRGLDIEAICPVSSSQLSFQLQLPKSSPFLHRA